MSSPPGTEIGVLDVSSESSVVDDGVLTLVPLIDFEFNAFALYRSSARLAVMSVWSLNSIAMGLLVP